MYYMYCIVQNPLQHAVPSCAHQVCHFIYETPGHISVSYQHTPGCYFVFKITPSHQLAPRGELVC